MAILAVYDTVGIQNYIFASNKLAENVGGSKLVEDILGKWLSEVIDKTTNQQSVGAGHSDGVADIRSEVIGETTNHQSPGWRTGDTNLTAEIIYQGGGNAFVAFGDDKTFQTVTKAFLVRVSLNAPGVGIAVAAVETEFGDTYKSDFDRLGKRLAAVKGGFNTPAFAGNQPITKQSGRTGLPVSDFENGEYLSLSQVKKRCRYAGYKKGSDIRINDFDDLAFEKGADSLIAIIHADGNNMGSRIKAFMEKFETYNDAVPAIRELSRKIDDCYRNARERTISGFKEAYADYVKNLIEKYPNKTFKQNIDLPPILDLIGGGDDTTLVIGGRFALDFAARLLREIEATPIGERPFEDSVPTACAGIVLFHAHYPFSAAYKFAEELCSSAKKPSRYCDGSYMDFHLHQSGSISGLRELRRRQYVVDGKSIVRRPWRVSKDTSDITPSFKWIEDNARLFKDSQEMPRNKLKALRNAIGAGDTAADIAISQMRGRKLPEQPNCSNQENVSKYAAYFDILELCDAYGNLLNKEYVIKTASEEGDSLCDAYEDLMNKEGADNA
jgi:hypothetical protein